MTMFKSWVCGALWCLMYNIAFALPDEDLQCRIEEVSHALGVTIMMDQSISDSWGAVTYEKCSNEEEVLRYLDLLSREFAKYPKGYLAQSCTVTIILGRNLNFCGQPRAAIPDPYKKQLFLSINGAFNIASRRYLAHVMHHELHHLTEYSMWKSMTFDWPEWILLNGDGFCYGHGGAEAYADCLTKGTDFFTPENPHMGFVNRYSLTGDEEDRAELMAFLMTDFDRPVIEHLMKKDLILRKKSFLLAKMLRDHGRQPIQFLVETPLN
jgi:hypothetical protein